MAKLMVTAINLYNEPDWDGEYQVSYEYEKADGETAEKTKVYKTLASAVRGAKKLQEKYGVSVNIL